MDVDFVAEYLQSRTIVFLMLQIPLTFSYAFPLLFDSWSNKLGTKIFPEMMFGKNEALFEHPSSGFRFSFNAFDALKSVDNTAATPKVKHAHDWKQRYDTHTQKR
jgi:hypothetical protein